MLLGFAAWTLLLLSATVGVYRWSRILTGRAGAGAFQADNIQGEEWYKRAMRAHANCMENLPCSAPSCRCASHFYSIQLACFLWLIALVVRQACC